MCLDGTPENELGLVRTWPGSSRQHHHDEERRTGGEQSEGCWKRRARQSGRRPWAAATVTTRFGGGGAGVTWPSRRHAGEKETIRGRSGMRYPPCFLQREKERRRRDDVERRERDVERKIRVRETHPDKTFPERKSYPGAALDGTPAVAALSLPLLAAAAVAVLRRPLPCAPPFLSLSPSLSFSVP